MEQSKGTLFVENWLSEDEKIDCTVTSILWQFSSPYPVNPSISNNMTPPIRGSIVLTNKRLIFIEEQWGGGSKPYPIPKWYSSTGVASLAERPPYFEKDWPYQAELTLESGIKVVIETDRGKDDKARELSKVLTKALFNLHLTVRANLFGQQMLEKQQEDEKRRRND